MPAVIQPFEAQDPEKGKHRGVIYTRRAFSERRESAFGPVRMMG